MGVRVVTDSACDLPQELVDAHAIEIVPLTIRFGDTEFVDREELSTEGFWQRLQASDVLPETAAPSAGAFESKFRGLIEGGTTGIVCINLSSRLSATMQAAQVAAAAVGGDCPVQVIDSLTCSMGLGRLCLTAARRAFDGDPLDRIVDEVISRRDRTQLFGALDTLEYLKKGGRIGNARALLGSMLSIKPVVEVRDGVVEEAGKVRTRSKSLRVLAEKVAAQPIDTLSVLHGMADDIDDLLDLLEPIKPLDEIVLGTVGPVIGTHAGPGVIGVTFQTRT
ncbi:MAG TPA: DegV family protein [Acidimicrobiia bacterium]|nr:DegV family protein [Acidimicrobiia bacterium]